jgi:hypothetical protein
VYCQGNTVSEAVLGVECMGPRRRTTLGNSRATCDGARQRLDGISLGVHW